MSRRRDGAQPSGFLLQTYFFDVFVLVVGHLFLYGALNASQAKRHLNNFRNNLGFLTSSSKKGNSMVDLMNKKMEKLREELNLLAEKIKAVDEQMKGE